MKLLSTLEIKGVIEKNSEGDYKLRYNKTMAEDKEDPSKTRDYKAPNPDQIDSPIPPDRLLDKPPFKKGEMHGMKPEKSDLVDTTPVTPQIDKQPNANN
jgi:hypothetical protein